MRNDEGKTRILRPCGQPGTAVLPAADRKAAHPSGRHGLAPACCLLPVLDSLLCIPFRGAGPKTGNGTYPFRRVPAGKNKKHSFKHP
ncbi:hypothetical protein [Bacteroides cellulosilyticus]|uniref:hypothetical protein n=1 Tax=Bacteroides cellulosilyticus TaxID=246787 RepID=UPI001865428E|nr:hypothetical protein [Bacteroides cellulosilyticus]